MWVPVRFLKGLLKRMRFTPGLVGLSALQRAQAISGESTTSRIIGALLLVLAASSLAGCSAIKIGYNQAPELGYWYLDDYVDFTGEQSLQIKAELTRLQAWHRQTQLPIYAELLQTLQKQAEGDASPAQACATFAELKRGFMSIAERVEPSAAMLVASLDASQLENIEKELAKGNTEYRKDSLEGSPQDIRSRRLKQAVKRAQNLYGKLDDQQVQALQKLLDRSIFDARRSYAERLRRQQDALQTMRSLAAVSPGKENATARSALRGLLERSITSPDGAYRKYSNQLADERCRMFAEFHNTTSPAQRAKAVETLRAYEADVKQLISQGNT